MSIVEIRQEVHKYIDQIDEKALQELFSFIKSYAEEDSSDQVGYTTSGEILTREKIIKRANEASERVRSGDYLTQEEVEKLSETW